MNILDKAIAAVSPEAGVKRAAARRRINILNSGYGNYGAWEGIKNIFGGAFGALVELAKAPIRAVVAVINGVIGGLNKLKVPDWVPGIGGNSINIPLIPEFAKGTNFTPDTFIAGERGAELITNARGRKVFTAAQTGAILDNIKMAKSINGIIPRISVSDSDTGLTPVQTAATQQTLAAMPQSSGGQSFTIQYSPTIYVDGNKPGDLEEKLKENNESLLQIFKDYIRQQRENERRMIYG